MSARRHVTLTVRFLCELAILAALAYWGFNIGDGAMAWVLAIGAPGLAIAIWGAFIAPKAQRPLPNPARVMVELLLFGAAALGLAVAGAPALGLLLAVAASVTSMLDAWDGVAGAGSKSPRRVRSKRPRNPAVAPPCNIR